VFVRHNSELGSTCGREFGSFGYFGDKPKCCNCCVEMKFCSHDEYLEAACQQCRQRLHRNKEEEIRRQFEEEKHKLKQVVANASTILTSAKVTQE
jgi:hypothetical protein